MTLDVTTRVVAQSRLRRALSISLIMALAMLWAGPLAGTAGAGHVTCGQTITQNTTLDSDVGPCPGDGVVVTASNITLDLNGHRIFAANGPGDNAGVRLIQVSGVTVQNGTVEGFDAGVAIMGGSGNTVQNMTLQDNINDFLGRPCDLGDGVAILNSHDNRILDNRVVHNGPFGGISVIEDSDRNLISGNVVLNHNVRSTGPSGCGNRNQDEGIRIEGPGANDNIVENNLVEGSGLAGIGLHGYVCTTARGDEIEDPNSGTIVRRNTVQNNEQEGISFLQQGPATVVCPSWGNTIERNISSNNGGDGIFVAANSHDNVISHNVVSNNALAGIRLNDPRFSNEFTNVGPTLLDLVQPDRAPYVEGVDYRVMSGSGSGDVTAELVAIDITLAPGADATNNPQPVDTSTSGCEQADYDAAGFEAGDVALIQRGTCTFVSKVDLAIANGASAVVMFNEGQAPDRTTFEFGAVGPVPIPVISTSYAVGFELYNLTQAGEVIIRVLTNTTNVETLAAPAPYDNTLIGNRGSGNAEVDGYDGNLEPPCDNNKWRASRFVTVNQPCVVGPGGSGTAEGRTGERPGNPDRGPDIGDTRGGSAGSRLT
ncbi:MAG: right-handed parallel beta-helix repeat-containing protein [Actinomycetota bacterium]|nr:right-handed parallel beta-helix repeat-containing protein [Actinomycetota bacterium]